MDWHTSVLCCFLWWGTSTKAWGQMWNLITSQSIICYFLCRYHWVVLKIFWHLTILLISYQKESLAPRDWGSWRQTPPKTTSCKLDTRVLPSVGLATPWMTWFWLQEWSYKTFTAWGDYCMQDPSIRIHSIISYSGEMVVLFLWAPPLTLVCKILQDTHSTTMVTKLCV